MRFYVVWLNQRSTDARHTIDASTLADPRVSQWWDGEAVIGRWLADVDLGGLGYSGIVYDTYYVFGPEAAWADVPGPLAGSGVPVISRGEELLAAIRAQP
ncbi:MAG TPA: hypothetical protein VML35_06735 [Gaiellaceae bacterium]|nr:hypothetical protein [Gaiellaceae bacterium]